MTMRDAVETSLAADTVADSDRAVADLALAYADAIDEDAGQLKDLGPKLLAALEAMQLSPRARSLARLHALGDRGGQQGGSAGSEQGGLDELRIRRARKSDPPAVDAPAT